MNPEKPKVTRRDFIVRLMDSGLTYVQAGTCYDAMVSVFSDAVVEGAKVSIGKMGILEPHILPPRTVKMGFRRCRGDDGKLSVVKNVRTEFTIGARLKYKLKLNKSFLDKIQLKWFAFILMLKHVVSSCLMIHCGYM